jgi:spore germination protein GerM
MKKRPYILIWAAVLLIILSIMLPSCSRSVTLYFAYMEGEEFYLSPEIREIDTSGDIYEEAIRQLIAGPKDESLYPTIPSDTSVNSIKVSDSLAVVDFDIRIISNFQEIPHSSTTETLAIYSIVNTLTSFEAVEQVKITVEGQENGEVEGFFVEDFWGHIGIYEEFTRNEEIIKDE